MSNIAQLVVYNAHNGTFVEIPKPIRFHTLQNLKEFLLESFSDHPTAKNEDIFLLSSFGIKLNFHTINEMSHLYYYDRHLFDNSALKEEALRYYNSSDNSRENSSANTINREEISDFSFITETEEKKISASFTLYEHWARGVLQQTTRDLKNCDLLIKKINHIFKSLNIIFQFISNFIKSAEKSFGAQYASIKLLWTKSLRNSWQQHYNVLKRLPAVQFSNSKQLKLSGLLIESDFVDAAHFVNENLPIIVERFNFLSSTMNSINAGTMEIDKMIERLRAMSAQNFKGYDSEKKLLADEIEKFNKAFQEDTQLFHTVPKREQRVIYIQQKEMALNFLAAAQNIHSYLDTLYSFHKNLVIESVPIFQAIARLQMNAVALRNDSKLISILTTPVTATALVDSNAVSPIPNSTGVTRASTATGAKAVEGSSDDLLNQVKQAEDCLSMTVDLPLLFGFTIIEKRRQFEWRDFFLKGLVNNISEQLTVVIEQEKSFQSLWIKKFGNYIRNLSPDADLLPQIPAVDVTLVNGDFSKRPNNIFAWIDAAQDMAREDILQYIELLKKNRFEKFASILEKNYKDMCNSTVQMSRMARVVSSIGAHAHLGLLKSEVKRIGDGGTGSIVDDGGTADYDMNLVEGLKLRIRKLENLLHQNQFKNLNNWPVVRSDHVPQTGQMSLIVSNSKESAPAQNPLKFLQKGISSPEVPTVKTPKVVLDASTTIDKHLDNIRLRRESNDLLQKNIDLQNRNKELELIKRELELKNKDLELQNKDLEDKNKEMAKSILDLEKTNNDQKLRIENLDNNINEKTASYDEELKQVRLTLENAENEKGLITSKLNDVQLESQKNLEDLESLRVEFTAVKAEMHDLVKIKSELLTNMLEKEQDYASEKADFQRKISDLSSDLDQKTDDFENLMEHMQTKVQSAEHLLETVNLTLHKLFEAIEKLSIVNIDYFREFCLVMQSMGLLLVSEPRKEDGKMEYRIKRVKGLRTKNFDEPDSDHLPVMKTTVIKDVDDAFFWLQTVKEKISKVDAENSDRIDSKVTEDAELLIEVQCSALLKIFSEFLSSGAGADGNEPSLLEKALKTISFKENVQLQTHENKLCLDEGFFYNGIIKRFSDVEGYAKKLTKENKMKAAELTRSMKSQNEKISINNFHEGDLVLFLPTVQNSDSEDDDQTPWTAFNIDAPHYFLDLKSQPEQNSKEWVVNRITKIVAQEVTLDNVSDKSQNPYSLSAGECWYLVLTEP